MKYPTILRTIFRIFLSILLLPFTILSLLLSSCATTTPQALQGSFSVLSPSQSTANPQTDISVRWGGRIIETLPENGRTCFQIMARPLSRNGRPSTHFSADDASEGRFLACHQGFYDPAVYQPGRDMTVRGNISGHQTIQIGEYDYLLPQVDADFVYLWPLLREVEAPPPYSPYYYPYGPWGPWYPWGRK